MSRRTVLLSAVAAVVMPIALAVPASASPPAPAWASPAAPGHISGPGPGSGAVTNYPGTLNAVSAASASDAWAVGTVGSRPVKTRILHWNGTSWQPVPSPNPGGVNGTWLFGVSDVSATSAWAVGYYYTNAEGTDKSLLLHWNGTSWTQISVPGEFLSAISFRTASDGWAVGKVILHWNGSHWRQVTPDPLGFSESLSSVSAGSSSAAWAVGLRFNRTNHARYLAMHWNGSRWQAFSIPGFKANAIGLAAVSALSPSDAWIAGNGPIVPGKFDSETLLLHWNGTNWQRVACPAPSGVKFDTIMTMDAQSPSDAWAVGYYWPTPTAPHTLMLHWNGTKWALVDAPSPIGGNFNALSATSSSDAWAAGGSAHIIGRQAYGNTWLMHWNGQRWTRT